MEWYNYVQFGTTTSERSLLGRVLGHREREAGQSVRVGASDGTEADLHSGQRGKLYQLNVGSVWETMRDTVGLPKNP